MGQYIAKVKRTARAPRAVLSNVDRVLEKKVAAPRHPSTVKAFDDIVQANPGFRKASKRKNDDLHKMLESIRVESSGAAPDSVLRSGKAMGKINILSQGKLSYDQIEEIYINCKVSPDVWTNNAIAKKYKLDLKVATNLLTHYSSFYIYKENTEVDISAKPFFTKDEEMPKLGSDSKN